MSNDPAAPAPAPQWSGLEVTPTLPEDPPKIGDYWLDGRIHFRNSGIAWLAHGDELSHPDRPDAPATGPAVVVQMSAGAASDRAARDRFSGWVNHLHIDDVLARGGQEQDEGRLGSRFRSEDDNPVDPDDTHPLAPWVALSFDGGSRTPGLAAELLADVDLEDLPPLGRPEGPDYRLHWIDRNGPGLTRIWPLPWPGRYDRAGWVTILISWFLMVVLAALAVLIAILIFRNSPPQSPPPPTGQSQSQQQQDPSPQSASASASASPESGSPSPSDSTSGSPSPNPTETSPGGGSPTPPSRL